MNILVSPDPQLKKTCAACEPGDRKLVKLAKKMARIMYKSKGCGLAAPQVGILKRLIVIDCDDESEEENPIFLVNPEIVELSGDEIEEGEGCLSFPGITVPITRKPYAKVRYFDLEGEECFIEGDGLLGRCLQHEIDHLNGRTLFDACAPLARLEAMRDYQVARESGAKPGDTSI